LIVSGTSQRYPILGVGILRLIASGFHRFNGRPGVSEGSGIKTKRPAPPNFGKADLLLLSVAFQIKS